MAGGSSYQDEEPGTAAISDINVTPLVDVTLVLLIIFMVTARLIAARGIQVNEPKTAAGDEVKSTLQVTIDPGGDIYVNGKTYPDPEDARTVIRTKLADDENLKAIISADETTQHRAVMEAIDLVKGAGVTKFALGSRPLDQASQ
jgi:biopolymer transport protein ExbD